MSRCSHFVSFQWAMDCKKARRLVPIKRSHHLRCGHPRHGVGGRCCDGARAQPTHQRRTRDKKFEKANQFDLGESIRRRFAAARGGLVGGDSDSLLPTHPRGAPQRARGAVFGGQESIRYAVCAAACLGDEGGGRERGGRAAAAGAQYLPRGHTYCVKRGGRSPAAAGREAGGKGAPSRALGRGGWGLESSSRCRATPFTAARSS